MVAVRERQGWQRLGSACLLHWHLCSLDAPTVAVVWALALAQLAEVRLTAAELAVLALGTWIVYVLDRVLDGQAGRLGGSTRGQLQQLQARHHFHRRHQRVLLSMCCAAAIMLGLVCRALPVRLVEFYLVLGVPVAGYGAWVHRRLIRSRLPAAHPLPATESEGALKCWPPRGGLGLRKEAAVAALFTAAVAAPALVGAQPAARPALVPAALLLAMLCWFNCVLISHAEAPAVHDRQRVRLMLTAAIAGMAGASTALWAWEQRGSPDPGQSGHPVPHSSPVAAAGLLSCLLLLSLLAGLRDDPASARRLRVLADVGLLTPLIFLLAHAG